MGINLRDYVNYDIDSWLTEEEAERIFEAAGYVKISEHKVDKPVYRDYSGEEIISGSKIIYQFNSPTGGYYGHVRTEDDELWVFWEDGHASEPMKDFWSEEYDGKITKVIGNIWD